ncbi:MAG: phosphoadenylyl-sulfate reductase [Rhodospirillales bacterium]|nr:phosphoadenylyl-sulfate reductase [Rhodospirillales bacterium]MBO6787753.1 phosphoadenylyl-sulfate reductase [Rhodospirillales bacterium]
MITLSADALNEKYQNATASDIVCTAIRDLFPSRIALVSSFGAESAVLLHMIARVDRATPVLFLDTLKHFDETLAHRDRLIKRLRLEDVRTVQPAASELVAGDPDGMLWSRDTDACCALRKTRPLDREIMRFNALFTGRKHHHGGGRDRLRYFEADGARIKVNPLVHWHPEEIQAYMERHALPAHPLVQQGYPSIGCAVCTSRVFAGEDVRAGRWRGTGKVECGIHRTPDAG